MGGRNSDERIILAVNEQVSTYVNSLARQPLIENWMERQIRWISDLQAE